MFTFEGNFFLSTPLSCSKYLREKDGELDGTMDLKRLYILTP